jgi:hypothetical protein
MPRSRLLISPTLRLTFLQMHHSTIQAVRAQTIQAIRLLILLIIMVSLVTPGNYDFFYDLEIFPRIETSKQNASNCVPGQTACQIGFYLSRGHFSPKRSKLTQPRVNCQTPLSEKFWRAPLDNKKRRTRRIRLRFGPVSRIDKSIFRGIFLTGLFQTSRTSTLGMAKSSVESAATERLAFTTESSAAKDAKASSSARSATAACTAVRGTKCA